MVSVCALGWLLLLWCKAARPVDPRERAVVGIPGSWLMKMLLVCELELIYRNAHFILTGLLAFTLPLLLCWIWYVPVVYNGCCCFLVLYIVWVWRCGRFKARFTKEVRFTCRS